MADIQKRKLRIATIVYWILLFYIVAALIWWFFSLYQQNEKMFELRRIQLMSEHLQNPVLLDAETKKITDIRTRNIAKYVSEGATFLGLLIFGAVFIYRSVRRQFRVQQQQQNFVMAITHELKTPIAVARLNLETLQRHKLDEPKRERLMQMTLQETHRLDALINNILLSSQLDVNAYESSKEEISFSDLTHDVVTHLIARYPERVIEEQVEEDIDMNGDPLLLKLLVSNLLENAHKYSPRDMPVSIQLKKDNDQIILEVSDLGPGIEVGERKNIFKKFYRIGNEQTRTAKGTGLGLYLCKKIVEDHSGSISVADNQPHGSTFAVRFPNNV